MAREKMSVKGVDVAAVTVAGTAPGWYQVLGQVNTVLSFISLILGILFLIYRWVDTHRDNKKKWGKDNEK